MAGRYDETLVPNILGAQVSLVALATISVGFRLWARRMSAAKFWWDDWVIILAVVLNLGLGTSYWLMVSLGGLGRHTVAAGGPVTPTDLVYFFKALLAVQVLYFSTAVAIKTSLILLYFRIFGVIRWFRWLLAGAQVIVALYFIVDVLVAVFECKPVAFYWDKTIKGGTCIDENQFYRWNGVANLLIDFLIWSLTLPVIWHLQLNNKQKLSLSGIFLLGLVACVASIVRVVVFNQVNFNDISWTLVGVATWTEIEQSIGIICACLPTLRPLFGRLLTNIKQVKSSSGHSGGTKPSDSNSNSIPLSDVHSRHTVERSLDLERAGFKRLDEEQPAVINTVSVATSAGKPFNETLPNQPQQGILTQQTLEQCIVDLNDRNVMR